VATTKKRDASYYRNRLRRDHPAIHADLLAGKFSSVRQAAAAAGLIHLPTRVDALKREWTRATIAERREFRDWLLGKARRPSPPLAIVDADRRLLKDVASFLADWVKAIQTRPDYETNWLQGLRLAIGARDRARWATASGSDRQARPLARQERL
jgi:hypothetical protein